MGAITSGIGALTQSLAPVVTLANTAVGLQNDVRQLTAPDPRDQALRDLQTEQDLALQQLQARQAQDEAQAATDAALERNRLATEANQAEQNRRDALRRAVSRQRVNFASQGIGSGDGSGEAVLLGLFEESDNERTRREELDNLRSRALDQSLSQRRSTNLLQASQLRERQALERARLF